MGGFALRADSRPVSTRLLDQVSPDVVEVFVGVRPTRVLDTRAGSGPIGVPAVGALGPGATITLAVAGVVPVPAGATSVVLSVVVDSDATLPSFVTIWPTGDARPLTSVTNPTPGTAVPTLTQVKLGAGGAVDIFNFQGSVNIAADVMGYYVPLSATGGGGGTPGPSGPSGAVGPSGAAGPSGAVGASGPSGPSGAVGASGPSGPSGPAGASGPTGATGPSGPSGADGALGPSGPSGPSGPTGITGPSGPSGPSGETGPVGPTGPSGPSGPTGTFGQISLVEASTAFTTFTVGTEQVAVATCPDGTTTISGGGSVSTTSATATVALTQSRFTPQTGTATGWEARAKVMAGIVPTAASVTAYAMCAS